MLVSLSYLVCNLWQKRKIHINTYFAATGLMLCVITHILKYKNIIQIVIIQNRSTMLSKNYFMYCLKTKQLLLKTYFGLSTLTLITRTVPLMVMNLYEKVKTSQTVTVICGIKNIHLLAPRLLVLLNVESHQRFLVLVQQSN